MKKQELMISQFIMGLLLVFASSCVKDADKSNDEKQETFTDTRDGNVYKLVKIGNQVWMAENLKYLPNVVAPTTGSSEIPYCYVYGYNGSDVSEAKATSNYTTYGVLYNWEAAKACCPTGWHLPSEDECLELIDYLGGVNLAGAKLKEKGTAHWESPNTSATNESSFTALPGGFRNYTWEFWGIGETCEWWTATEYDAVEAIEGGVGFNSSEAGTRYIWKENGFSVRCVKD